MEIEGRPGRGGGRRGGRQGWRKGGNNGHPLKNHLNPAWNGFDRFVNPTAVHGMYNIYFLKISNLYPMLNYKLSEEPEATKFWMKCPFVFLSSFLFLQNPGGQLTILPTRFQCSFITWLKSCLARGFEFCVYHIIHEPYFISICIKVQHISFHFRWTCKSWGQYVLERSWSLESRWQRKLHNPLVSGYMLEL